MGSKSIKYLLLISCLCTLDTVVNGNAFTDENEQPNEPFVPKKAELFRFSRSAKGNQMAKYSEQKQQVVEEVNQEQPVAVVQEGAAVEQPAFSTGEQQQQQDTNNQQQQQQQQEVAVAQVDQNLPQQSSSQSSSSKLSKSKTIKTITTTTTTTTQNGQDQPHTAQIKEIRVHTVPLSEAVHYANYVVVPTHGAKAAHLEESSSSSSSSHKSSSSTSTAETESVIGPAPTVVVNPPPSPIVSPDCVLHRLIVERPVTSQLVVKVPSEIGVRQSSSSSHSSRIVSETVAAPAPPATVVVKRIVHSAPVVSARIVSVASPANDGHLKEEHFRSESRSSRQESHGGLVSSSSSSSSSSRSSKSSSTTTSQETAALVAAPPPPPPVHTYTVVHQAAPLAAVKAPIVAEVSKGRSNDYSVNVDHHYSGPNVKYGYSIKQQSHEPDTKGVVVGERVVYFKK